MMSVMTNTIDDEFRIQLMEKPQKKSVLRFYKQHHYSARFIGHDTCFIITKNDEIIGACIISKVEQVNFFHALVIDPKFQGRGLASKLINDSLNTFGSLLCFADIKHHQFYLKLGFSAVNNEQFQSETSFQPLISRFKSYKRKQPLLKAFKVTRNQKAKFNLAK